MELTLAKAANTALKMPDAKALEKLFSVATNHEVAVYFHDRLAAQVTSCGLSVDFKDVMTEVKKFAEIVKAQTETGSEFWSGQVRDAAVSSFRNFQINLSVAATEALQSKFADKPIQFDFAMDNNSALLQGFSTADGSPLDEEAAAQMNAIYSDWLTERGMICEDGFIYESSEDGNKKKIEEGKNKGKDKKVDPEDYKKAFMGERTDNNNTSQGFAAFVKQKSKLEVKVNDVSATVFANAQASQSTGSAGAGAS